MVATPAGRTTRHLLARAGRPDSPDPCPGTGAWVDVPDAADARSTTAACGHCPGRFVVRIVRSRDRVRLDPPQARVPHHRPRPT